MQNFTKAPGTGKSAWYRRMGRTSLLASGGLLAGTLVLGGFSVLVRRMHLDGGVLILPWTDLIRLLLVPGILLWAVLGLVASLFAAGKDSWKQIGMGCLAIGLALASFPITNVIARANLSSQRLPPGVIWWTAGF